MSSVMKKCIIFVDNINDMKQVGVEGIYHAILLLSEAEQEDLYLRMQKKLHKSQPEIVAYTMMGKPLTQKQYMQEIDLGLRQIERGETISDEDLQKEIDTW